MKVLVTGCAGMIGSRVSARLLKDGHSVSGVDVIGTDFDQPLKEWRLAQLLPVPGFSFSRTDITDTRAVNQVFQDVKFDAVINLAAKAGVRKSIEFPLEYYETNVIGTLNLLEACRQSEVIKFVLSSTSSVYGKSNQQFREDDWTDRPLSPYAASKKAAENLCYAYHHVHGMDISALRYFTVYGPAGRPDMAILRFIQWIAEGEALTVYGDGSQERDFTFVDDIARGTVASLKPLGFEVINLGSDSPVTVRSVIELTEDLLGKEAQINNLPPNLADVPSTWADVSKAHNLLDWQPETTLKDGLSRTVTWYNSNRDLAKRMCELSFAN